jgi:hypothetical protein
LDIKRGVRTRTPGTPRTPRTLGNESSDELGRGGVERVARGCTRWEEVWSEEGWGDSGKGETRRAIILGVSHTRGGTIIHVGAWRSM